jgi:hypothetical protein
MFLWQKEKTRRVTGFENVMCATSKRLQMQGAPEADTGSVHERTLRMAAEEQRRRWTFYEVALLLLLDLVFGCAALGTFPRLAATLGGGAAGAAFEYRHVCHLRDVSW